MTVLFLPEVEDYLYELIEILYHKDYFGYKESAINNVEAALPKLGSQVFSKSKTQFFFAGSPVIITFWAESLVINSTG